MISVNWKEIFSRNGHDVVRFANGNINFKDFKRSITDKTVRKEVNKLENHHTSDERRRLARRACRRRNVNLVSSR